MTNEEKRLNETIKQDGIDTQSEILNELKRRYPQYVEQSNNEQEIERILEIMHSGIFLTHSDCAIALVNAGIGDKKQAVKDFVDNKAKPLISELVELMFDDNIGKCKVDNCEKSDDIPCGASICVEENKRIWESKIDELFTQLYGEEE